MTTQEYREKLVDSIDKMISKYHLKSKYNLLYKPGTHDIEYLEDYKSKVAKYAINNRVTLIQYPIIEGSLVTVLPKNITSLEEGIKYINSDEGLSLLKKDFKYYLFNGDNVYNVYIKKT